MHRLISKGYPRYLLYIVGSAFLGLGVQCLVVLVVSFFSDSGLVRQSIGITAGDMFSYAFLFVLCREKGYTDNRNDAEKPNRWLILNMALACVTYMLVTILMRYRTGAATNVVIFAQILVGDMSLDINQVVQQFPGATFVSLLIQSIPMIPAMILGHTVGIKKRVRERKQTLTENEQV